MDNLEERVMFNVLKSIRTGDEHKASPDKEYLKSLEGAGIITLGWDTEITPLGNTILSNLRDKFEKW